MTRAWRLYYADGSTWDDGDGPWSAAPAHGVVALVVRDPTGQWGRWVDTGYSPSQPCERCGRVPGNEYYVCVPGEAPYATWDLAPAAARCPDGVLPAGAVKAGAMVAQERWQTIMRRAADDADFPKGTPRRRATDA